MWVTLKQIVLILAKLQKSCYIMFAFGEINYDPKS